MNRDLESPEVLALHRVTAEFLATPVLTPDELRRRAAQLAATGLRMLVDPIMHEVTVAPQSEYVVGFLFSKDRKQVALIRKNRPEWQAGRWNGIGGKVEPGESPYDAMRREFAEEAGIWLPCREWTDMWEPFATISGPEKTPGEVSFRVHYFRCVSSAILNLESCTDETVAICTLGELPETVTNPRWLIEMALSMDQERAAAFEITEVSR